MNGKLCFCLVFVATIILIIPAIHLFSLVCCDEFYMEYGMVLPNNTQREVLYDDSGSFARDWIRLYKFKFSNEQTEKFMNYIRDFGKWEHTPMPNDLNIPPTDL